MAELDERVRRLRAAERNRAESRQLVEAYRLELRHFERHLQLQGLPELTGLPLLRRSSDRILDYLAESEIDDHGSRPGLLRRIRRYFRYGSLRGLDPGDTDVVLQLQRAYYEKRIAELDERVAESESELRRSNFDELTEEQRNLSTAFFDVALRDRYTSLSRQTYLSATYRRGGVFAAFMKDYPVLLSTCHSLRRNLPEGFLLDYLIIDEASQVDLLAAGLVLSSCRNLIVVGDLRQLPPVADAAAVEGLEAPRPAYDCRRHSILSSLTDLYGDGLSRTLLREHYRCDPAIIGFCNKMFYDGELIPFTTAGSGQAMVVVRTVEGNHMRQHLGGGRSNQREVDVIKKEVIPTFCGNVDLREVGVATPYRYQVDKVTDALIDSIEASTVHSLQGQQMKVVILTTVLDDSWRGRTGLKFADDPHLVNVAVSRAVDQFILVTSHGMLPTSRYLRDLIDYIRYQSPDEDVVDSAITSMFDLLYRTYNERLKPLAGRLRNEMQFKSEDIIWTVLREILSEDRYGHLTAVHHVLLRNLLQDTVELTPRQEAFVQRRASVDFVVYNKVTNRASLIIEVDGFAYHENNPDQLERDAVKDAILRARSMPLLRLKTTDSGEERRIREALDSAERGDARMVDRGPFDS